MLKGVTELDDLASIISIGMPIIFVNISVYEQMIILYIYITTSYLSHSELYWSHHSIHHKLLNYNYCILFPIFDVIFGTYRSDFNYFRKEKSIKCHGRISHI